ncbi:hypothetical protein GQ597_07130 [Gilliamella sp. Pra-s65]|nr:hypothetical protein [Gilliamella sp. Pra-s65]MWP47148.1 hypothetical protein [Gilliamella sp. Pas-s27]MWP73431.1 hypothetical protein [Gilliamella sp. Pra-s52]
MILRLFFYFKKRKIMLDFGNNNHYHLNVLYWSSKDF